MLYFQSFLDAFSDAAASPYGCLLVCGKVAVATRKWWSLTSTELVLLAMLVNSLPKCSSRDLPVFLPHGSPKVSSQHMVYSFNLECLIFRFTALLDGICATLNLRIQALKLQIIYMYI